MRRKHLAIVGAAIILLIMVVGLCCFIPCLRTEHRGYNCRICGAQETKTTTLFPGVPIWRRQTEPRENSLTSIYAKHIGIAHEHQWCGGGYWKTVGTLLKPHGVHGDGRHAAGGYPMFQPRLTHMALTAISQVDDWHKDDKIALHGAIIDCRSEAEYRLVVKSMEDTKTKPAGEVWLSWYKANKELKR